MGVLKTYSISTEITEGAVCKALSQEIIDSGHVTNPDGYVTDGDSLIIMGDALVNEAGLDALILAHKVMFPMYRTEKIDLIVAKTKALILANGYEYPLASGNKLSLTAEAKAILNGLVGKKDDPAMVYPIKMLTLDNTTIISLADATEVNNLYMTALGTIRAYYDAETVLIEAVNVAVDNAGVDAVVDNR